MGRTMIEAPSIIISTIDNETLHEVLFEDVYRQRENITTALLRWKTNSYFLNIKERSFTVDGDKIFYYPEFFDAHMIYIRRNKLKVNISDLYAETEFDHHQLQHLFGLQGKNKQDQFIERFLCISVDGTNWSWQTRR
jgi:hypothetical protein